MFLQLLFPIFSCGQVHFKLLLFWFQSRIFYICHFLGERVLWFPFAQKISKPNYFIVVFPTFLGPFCSLSGWYTLVVSQVITTIICRNPARCPWLGTRERRVVHWLYPRYFWIFLLTRWNSYPAQSYPPAPVLHVALSRWRVEQQSNLCGSMYFIKLIFLCTVVCFII